MAEGNEHIRIVSAPGIAILALAFLVLFTYELVYSPISTLFRDDVGAHRLPYVWLAVTGTIALVVHLYNRAARRRSLRWLAAAATAGSAITLLALLLTPRTSWTSFSLVVWRDVHIVVLIEILWAIANVRFAKETATKLYGILCAAGSCGSVVGDLTVTRANLMLPTQHLLWLAFPCFLASALLFARVAKHAPRPSSHEARRRWAAPGLLSTRRIRLLFVIVVLVQVSITLVDYGYEMALAQHFSSPQDHTEAGAQVRVYINAGALALGLLSGPILRTVGERFVLLAVPLLGAMTALGALFFVGFATMATAKVTGKTLDYSLFRTAKELLYLPLTYREKVAGKALIDAFGYRFAKGGASLIALLLIHSVAQAWIAAFVVMLGWWLATMRLFRASSR